MHMSRSRRHPPLFEALGDVSRRREGTPTPAEGTGPLIPKHPVIVQSPAAPAGSGLSGRLAGRTRPILFLVAALIALTAIAWSLGYHFGENRGKQAVKPFTSPDDAAALTGQDPNTMPGAVQSILPVAPPPVIPSSKPQERPSAAAVPTPSGMPPITGPDPRKPGYNYLNLGTLTWKDAEQAVRFLQANGLRATCYPQKKVDPAQAQAKNEHHIVIIADGVASSQFKASKQECAALEAAVRKVGRRFLKEERGASDFAAPFWAVYRGQ